MTTINELIQANPQNLPKPGGTNISQLVKDAGVPAAAPGSLQTSPSTQSPPATTPPSGSGWLPTVGGIAGNLIGRVTGGLLGGAAGTAAEPGGGTILGAFGGQEAGGAAGGAIGQAAGEFLSELMGGKGISGGEIAKEGAIGGVFGAIPGGTGDAASIIGRTGVRMGVGAATGAITQGISDIGNKQSAGENAGNIAQSAAVGAGANALLGGLGDLVFHTLPNDLMDLAIKKPAETASALQLAFKQGAVGTSNIAAATEEGILPKGNISVPSPGTVGRVTASGLGQPTGLEATGTNIFDKMMNTTQAKFGEVGSLLKPIWEKAETPIINIKDTRLDGKSVYDLTSSIAGIVNDNKSQDIMGEMWNEIGGEKDIISIEELNKMKSVLGTYTGPDSPKINTLYNTFKTFVKEAVGPENTSDFDAINERFQNLYKIKATLQGNMKMLSSGVAKGLSEQAIQDAVTKAGQGAPENLKTTAAWIAIFGMAGVGKAIGGIEGAATGGGVGMMMGVRNGIAKVLDGMVNSPESKEELANALRKILDSSSPRMKQAIIDALKQLAVRTPQLPGLQQQPTTGAPNTTQ